MIEQYAQLRINSISIAEIDDTWKISLQPVQSNPDWLITWQLKTPEGEELLVKETNEDGLDYPVHLVFHLADLFN